MNATELSPLLDAKDAAELLKVAVPTIYRWAESGHLPVVKVGRLVRFRREALKAWIEAPRTPLTHDTEQEG